MMYIESALFVRDRHVALPNISSKHSLQQNNSGLDEQLADYNGDIDSTKNRALEKSIQYLKTQHRDMLHALQSEIETLRLKNKDLQQKLILSVNEDKSNEVVVCVKCKNSEIYLNKMEEKIKHLVKELQQERERNIDLQKRLEKLESRSETSNAVIRTSTSLGQTTKNYDLSSNIPEKDSESLLRPSSKATIPVHTKQSEYGTVSGADFGAGARGLPESIVQQESIQKQNLVNSLIVVKAVAQPSTPTPSSPFAMHQTNRQFGTSFDHVPGQTKSTMPLQHHGQPITGIPPSTSNHSSHTSYGHHGQHLATATAAIHGRPVSARHTVGMRLLPLRTGRNVAVMSLDSHPTAPTSVTVKSKKLDQSHLANEQAFLSSTHSSRTEQTPSLANGQSGHVPKPRTSQRTGMSSKDNFYSGQGNNANNCVGLNEMRPMFSFDHMTSSTLNSYDNDYLRSLSCHEPRLPTPVSISGNQRQLNMSQAQSQTRFSNTDEFLSKVPRARPIDLRAADVLSVTTNSLEPETPLIGIGDYAEYRHGPSRTHSRSIDSGVSDLPTTVGPFLPALHTAVGVNQASRQRLAKEMQQKRLNNARNGGYAI